MTIAGHTLRRVNVNDALRRLAAYDGPGPDGYCLSCNGDWTRPS